MKRTIIFAASLLSCIPAFAQSAPSQEAFIASRQVEVERLAESLYAARLDDGKWTHNLIPQCGTFTHHLFTSFEGTPTNGMTPRFVAIYDLDHPPAPSADKPWQGGILLLRVKSPLQSQQDSVPGEDSLITALNRSVAKENAATIVQRPFGMDPLEVANCFIGMSGNEPKTALSPKDPADKVSQAPVKVASILTPLIGTPGLKRIEYVDFDEKGAITKAGVLTQRTPQ